MKTKFKTKEQREDENFKRAFIGICIFIAVMVLVAILN